MVVQQSRNQYANGTYSPEFVIELSMSNPWYVYFLKIEKELEKVGSLAVFLCGYFQVKSIIYLYESTCSYIFLPRTGCKRLGEAKSMICR